MARLTQSVVRALTGAALLAATPGVSAGGCCGPIVAAVEHSAAAIVGAVAVSTAAVEKAGLAITRQLAVNLQGERQALDAQTKALVAAIQGQTAALAAQEAQRQFGVAGESSSSAPSACEQARLAQARHEASASARASAARVAGVVERANAASGADARSRSGAPRLLAQVASGARPEVLFGPAWMDPDGDGALSSVESAEVAEAIVNATNPLPPPAPSEALRGAPRGVEYEAMRQLYLQRARAAQAVLRRQAALAEPAVDVGGGQRMSELQVLERVARRTTRDPAWLERLDAETTMAGVLRELAVLAAESYRLDLVRLRTEMDSASMLAMLLAGTEQERARALREAYGRMEMVGDSGDGTDGG